MDSAEIFREILASWTPSPPPKRGGSSRSHGPPIRPTPYTDGGGSIVDRLPLDPWKHEVRWQVIYSRTPLKVNLWTHEFRFIPFRILRFHVIFLLFFKTNSSLDSSHRSRSLSIFYPLVPEIRFKVTYRSGSSVT